MSALAAAAAEAGRLVAAAAPRGDAAVEHGVTQPIVANATRSAAAAGESRAAGPTGAGILLKLCNNLMTYAAFAAIDRPIGAICHGVLALARVQWTRGPALALGSTGLSAQLADPLSLQKTGEGLDRGEGRAEIV